MLITSQNHEKYVYSPASRYFTLLFNVLISLAYWDIIRKILAFVLLLSDKMFV